MKICVDYERENGTTRYYFRLGLCPHTRMRTNHERGVLMKGCFEAGAALRRNEHNPVATSSQKF